MTQSLKSLFKDLSFKVLEPSKRSVSILIPSFKESTESFFLPFPYMLFVEYELKGHKSYFVYLCNEYPTINTQLFLPPLGNIFTNKSDCIFGYICTENLTRELPNVNLEKVISYFWQSGFGLGWLTFAYSFKVFKNQNLSYQEVLRIYNNRNFTYEQVLDIYTIWSKCDNICDTKWFDPDVFTVADVKTQFINWKSRHG